MQKNSKPVFTVLHAVATQTLDSEVQDDLDKKDPDMDRARAALAKNQCGHDCSCKDTNKG